MVHLAENSNEAVAVAEVEIVDAVEIANRLADSKSLATIRVVSGNRSVVTVAVAVVFAVDVEAVALLAVAAVEQEDSVAAAEELLEDEAGFRHEDVVDLMPASKTKTKRSRSMTRC